MSQSFRRVVAPFLALLLILTTAPLSGLGASEIGNLGAADTTDFAGSLRVVGPVQLRGVALSREGTVFPGDTVRTREAAYARLRLTGGQQIELGSETEIEVLGPGRGGSSLGNDAGEAQIAMRSGTMAFSVGGASAASGPLTIHLDDYTVLAPGGSAGDLTFLDAGWVGVRAMEGSMTIQSGEGRTVVDAGESETFRLDAPEAVIEGAAGPVAPQAQLETFSRTALWVALGAIGGGVVSYLIWGKEEASPN
jgi:ferric-dicitrate binding protein FerR (iron transport regulator)